MTRQEEQKNEQIARILARLGPSATLEKAEEMAAQINKAVDKVVKQQKKLSKPVDPFLAGSYSATKESA